jgi:hypothetical protein
MTTKFEQLIEFVINDEQQRARELFHDIVVEKSRQIYEEMMQDDESEEGKEIDEAADEDIEESLGGDQADDLIDDVETEEEGISMEGDEEGEDHHADMGGEEELEDRVVDLEDKLDELMAEFEALMGDEKMDGMDGDMDMDMDMDVADDDGMTDIEVADDELETEGMFNENVSLKSAPAPVKSEESGINKKAVVAANSGARGAVAKPVGAGTNEGGKHDATGAYSNSTKELIGKVGNTPAQGTQNPTPATKPHLAQASGVNTKSVVR